MDLSIYQLVLFLSSMMIPMFSSLSVQIMCEMCASHIVSQAIILWDRTKKSLMKESIDILLGERESKKLI